MSMFVGRFKGSSRIIPSPPTPTSRHDMSRKKMHWRKYSFRNIHHNLHLEMIRPFRFDGCITSNIIKNPTPDQPTLPPLFSSVWSGSRNQRVEASARFNPWSSSSPSQRLGGHVADTSVNPYFWGSDSREQKTHQLLQASVVLSATICHCYSDHVLVPRCSSSFSVKASCTCPPASRKHGRTNFEGIHHTLKRQRT